MYDELRAQPPGSPRVPVNWGRRLRLMGGGVHVLELYGQARGWLLLGRAESSGLFRRVHRERGHPPFLDYPIPLGRHGSPPRR